MPQAYDHYFAEEAREHLDQLERLLALPERPDSAKLLQLASAVLTSAQRAGAGTVAAVAERLEDAARSIHTGNIAWSEEIRRLSRSTVADLKLLLRALNRWGEEEERRVREAIARIQDSGFGIQGGADDPVPIESLLYDEADEVVPIETLLLRGDAALREALRLRPELEAIARGDATPERPLAELVDELFGLLDAAQSS